MTTSDIPSGELWNKRVSPGGHLTSHIEYTPRVILVTGGAGFIGCNFVRYMLEVVNEN